MALDALDKIYIDQAMERNRIQFRDEMEIFFHKQSVEHKRHMDELKADLKKENEQTAGALIELVRDDLKKGIEIICSKPDREEVRQIAREEARYLIREDFNRYIVPNIREVVREEVAPLRKELDRHDREIKALKLKSA